MTRIKVHPMSLGMNDLGSREIHSAPYPLGCLVAHAKAHHDGVLCAHFDFQAITPITERDVPAILEGQDLSSPSIVLLSSYVWNHEVNLAFARRLKQRSPQSLVIVGGPHIPRLATHCEQFLRMHPSVDVAARNEGEVTLAEVLETVIGAGADPEGMRALDFSSIAGITYRDRASSIVRTAERPRMRDLGALPSPYTTGEFDHWIDGASYMPIETNRGCPYGCTFCDWGSATLAKVHTMSQERVYAEIEYAGRHRVPILGLCDANFGILPRDLEIARWIVRTKQKYGYPREVGYTNAKTANPRVREIIKLLWDEGLISAGQISMQTTDDKVLDIVKRSNIKMAEYEKIITFFHEQGISAVSDMMIGLPGQDFETCKKDLQFFFDRQVTAMIFSTSVMPNAPMADEKYREQYEIIVDGDGFVQSTFSFTGEDYARIFELCVAYKLFVKLGVLRYVLYFMQLEHGVKAMDFIVAWLRASAARPEAYPLSHYVTSVLLDRDYRGGSRDWLVLNWTDEQGAVLFENLAALYQEALRLYTEEFGVRVSGSDVEAVLAGQLAVMPHKQRHLASSVALPHDLVGYFAAVRRVSNIEPAPPDFMRLRDWGPGRLELRPRAEISSYAFGDIDPMAGRLELETDLRM